MNYFPEIVEHILKLEGGWSDHRLDPGGATNMGITLRVYRRWMKRHGPTASARRTVPSKGALRNISKSTAKQIYDDFYWTPISGAKLAGPVAWVVFDSAVNQGTGQAAKFLQRAVGGLKVDGKIGPKTLAAAAARDPYELATEIAVRRALHYTALRHFATFGRGWLRRLFRNHAKAIKCST
jgi:lysozyme family protein